MTRFWSLKINRKLLLINGIIIYTIIFFLTIFLLINHRKSVIESVTSGAEAVINTIPKQLQSGKFPPRIFTMENSLATYNFAIYDRRGKRLTSTFPQLFNELHMKYSAEELTPGKTFLVRNRIMKLIIKDKGPYHIEGLIDLTKIDQSMFSYGIRLSLIMFLIGLVIIASISLVTHFLISSPLLRFKEGLISIFKGEKFSFPEPDSMREDEIADIFHLESKLTLLWKENLSELSSTLQRSIDLVDKMENSLNNIKNAEVEPDKFFNDLERITFQIQVMKDFLDELRKMTFREDFNKNISTLLTEFVKKWEVFVKLISEEISQHLQIEKEKEKWNENLVQLRKNIVRAEDEIRKLEEITENVKNRSQGILPLVNAIREKEEVIENSINETMSTIGRIREIINSMENNRSFIRNTLNEIELKMGDIEEFTDQTNLLSLNASIISAQVTSIEGRSFEIIAEEVKGLSEVVFSAIQEMENKIRESREFSNANSGLVEELMKELGMITKFVDIIKKSLNENTTNLKEISEEIRNTDTLLDQLVTQLNKINSVIEPVASDNLEWIDELNTRISQIEKFIASIYEKETELTPDITKLRENINLFKEEWARYETRLEHIIENLMEIGEGNRSLYYNKNEMEKYLDTISLTSEEVSRRLKRMKQNLLAIMDLVERNTKQKRGSEK